MGIRINNPGQVGGTNFVLKAGVTISPAQAAVYQDDTTLETFLLANGYTAARLALLNHNDKVHAVRLKQGL